MKITINLNQGVIGLALAFFIAASAGYFWGEQSVVPNSQQALFSFAGPLQLPARTLTSGCSVVGPLPDSECTPGAVFPNVSAEQTCVAGYTKTVRSVSTSTKKQIYREYGIQYPQPFGSYEVDHFIPLTLGGSNDVANLFPEAATPAPGFPEKDLVEDYLHQKVCDGGISLVAAQHAIATNWVNVYDSISPSDLARLKQEYKSWAATGD